MKHTQIIETSIDLFTSTDIYAVDIQGLINKKLTERYVGRCYASMLILRIGKLIKYSDVRMVDNRLDGGASLDVMFEAEGIVLVKGEVLHGCEVIDIKHSGIMIRNQYVYGAVLSNPKYKITGSISIGQLMPVIIENVRYNINSQRITVQCYPFVPKPIEEPYYLITEPLSDSDAEKVTKLLQTLSEELKLAEDTQKQYPQSYAFFKELMYPYKTKQKFTDSPIGSKFKFLPDIELKTLTQISSGCLVCKDVSSNELFMHSDAPDQRILDLIQSGNLLISSPAYPVIASILNKRIMYVSALRGFAEQYNTAEKAQKLSPYWKQCNSFKV